MASETATATIAKLEKEIEEKAQQAELITQELARSEFQNEDAAAKIIQLDNKIEQHRE